MSEPTPVDALVSRILGGEAPLTLRAAAARGALPLPRAVLTRLYLHLRTDADEDIRKAAHESLATLDGETLQEVLSDPTCTPEVLTHFAPLSARDEALAEKIAFHPAVTGQALSILATAGNATIIDLVLTNQQKIFSSPGLLDKLSANPALRPDQRGRILDLLDVFFREKVHAKEEGSLADAAPEGETPIDLEETARLLDLDVGELFAASEIVDGEEFERAADPALRTAYHRILTLSTAQKAMLAMKGGREERMILIRDTNKLVALSVLKNGRITEREVEMISNMRNVSDEILRLVGTNRDWSKNYVVVGNLVRNPRTPPGVSTNFISRLTSRDLKGLGGDKNVPEIIRRMAKRTYDLRTQKTEPSVKKR